ncbi:hypothetical protein LMG22037_05955 [Paraburkholderia phenoliruptrix]|uniref:Uncharacterized protein n=1 Tax=Paraburkholderia phenoliruptrix TaxID=252970 RepID=A0A6J5CG04_9BURK|nr:hypothetical protein [Paraburkholderia phenoliruptrix]CAB3735326.1 hypothetical protein LMG22037_05955 [Paraburkholderia phenoliruptrix]
MPIVKNFFYTVGIAFLVGLQSVNPDKDLLRQFVLMLQSDNFWTIVKLGTLVLTALEWIFSAPVSSSSPTDDLKDFWGALKRLASQLAPAGLGTAGGPDLGSGFAQGASDKGRLNEPAPRRTGQAARTPDADLLKTDQPLNDNERTVAKRMWESSEAVTIDDMSDWFLRSRNQCIQELIGMGLYPHLAAVCAEDSRRLNLRAGNC